MSQQFRGYVQSHPVVPDGQNQEVAIKTVKHLGE